MNLDPLSKVQKLVFIHAWDGLAYDAIARATGYDTGYIKDVGAKLWRQLSEGLGEPITKFNFRVVLQRYQPQLLANAASASPTETSLSPHQDWGEAVDVLNFYGRTQELELLGEWLTEEHCRQVAILGMGGVGKTSLSVKLAEQVQHDYQCLFWRSLRDAPPLEDFLATLLQFLAQGKDLALPDSQGARLSLLIDSLRTARCLIVLDNFDALFEPGQRSGTYRDGYQGYGDLLHRIGETRHQSCLVITSREKPREIGLLQGEETPVRVLALPGLAPVDATPLLTTKGVKGSEQELGELIDRYQGNPLALKITATSICDLFNGDIPKFLAQDIAVFNGIRHLLRHQIERISALEATVMFWLAINRMPVMISELLPDIVPSVPASALLEALESLRGRSLIEQTSQGFTQQPVVMEYVTSELIAHLSTELANPGTTMPFLKRFAVLKATAKDYVRESQVHVIVELLVQQAIAQLGSQQQLIDQLLQLLRELRHQSGGTSGYAIGNLINLLTHLEVDLTAFDLSRCQVRQAYLAEAKLQDVSLAFADVTQSVFAETFGGISCTAYRADGRWLATSDTSGEVHIWDIPTYKQVSTFKADTVWTWTVAFAPPTLQREGNPVILATAGDDRLVKLWHAETGQCLQTLKGHTNTINALAFSPQGNILASGSQDATVRLWQLDAPQAESAPCLVLDQHQGRVWAVAFSPDGESLVSASEDCTLKVWNLDTQRCDRTLAGHRAWIKAVAVSPSGKYVASGSFSGTIKLWDFYTGDCLHSWQAHPSTVTALAFSPDGALLASSSYDQTVKAWQVSSGKCVRTLREHHNRVWSVAFSPDGQQLASGGDDHAARIWDLKTDRCAKTWKGHTNSILSLAIEPDSQWLATGHEDQTIKLWHPETGKVMQTLHGHSNRVWSVMFAPATAAYATRTTLLASGSGDRTIKLWDTQTGHCLTTLKGHTSWVWSVAFHPHQPWLASGSYDQTVKLWNLDTGHCFRTLDAHTAPVVSVTFSANGQWLASSSFDQTIRLYEAQSGQCVRVLNGHENSVWIIQLSANGQYLASGSYDQTVKLWDLSTGLCRQTFTGHTGPVVSLAFSQAERHVISGSFDNTIKIWDIETGDCIQTLQGHGGLVSAIALPPAAAPAHSPQNTATSPGQPTFWSGSFDETIKQWHLETQTCLQTCRTPRPYDGLNITGVSGLTDTQKITLKSLGAIEAAVAR
ncbi:NB-ARC domain-containing protein [Phormidium tenue]|uniref:NB-ARC domain-containing protein n=1 Tax=Phormidium tenue TaxID=126344 RepID=UPI001683BBDB|nr:NB-ARC domain-containing protein [Phormidium tenue]MBD2234112.1 NACHT domain-containing protein [Phormidium tenue FACHB-1052]